MVLATNWLFKADTNVSGRPFQSYLQLQLEVFQGGLFYHGRVPSTDSVLSPSGMFLGRIAARAKVRFVSFAS
jgi:hypothetical protein